MTTTTSTFSPGAAGSSRAEAPDIATDPIALELLRKRLEAIAEDAAITMERTGVSPTFTETHDLAATLLDAEGNLVAGGGWVALQFAAAPQSIRATIARYGDTIRPGDVFLANDPYTGGGLHPNDVVVSRPIFAGDRLVAWVSLSAHLLDMGGMAAGSFAAAATECYQEAFRLPPVRLFRSDVEVSEVWDILRTNVRMGSVVEMDLRALVAGAYVADQKVVDLVETVGFGFFESGVKALQDLTERELRKRITAMPDGVYRSVSWAEWDEELYKIPCTMTIDGDRMIFDFEGAAPQAPHFFNSRPYIVKSAMAMQLVYAVASDLPYTEGLLTPIEMRCPEGSIVNAHPPAPNAAAHMHVGAMAAELMLQCVRFALYAASPALPSSRYVHGVSGAPSMCLGMWAGVDVDGHPSIWGMVEGAWTGVSAGTDRDGIDNGVHAIGMAKSSSNADIEVLEAWHPFLVLERGVRRGVNGAGAFRSGMGAQMRVQPYGTPQLTGEMVGLREWLPLEGAAGGFPGSTAVYEITRLDGRVERISTKASGVVLREGETFAFRCGSGGGVGDPLDRRANAVADDVAAGIITREEARAVYGVILDAEGDPDSAATDACRAEHRASRLARAAAPLRPVHDAEAARLSADSTQTPLYPGIVQRGAVAFAERSGAPLAIAPHHWTDGCAVLEEDRGEGGPALVTRAYLDPKTGQSLYVEVTPKGEPRSFEISPVRWTAASAAA